MSFRGRVKLPTKVQKDATADEESSNNTSGVLREFQQNLYRRLFAARKEIQTTIHANDGMPEYSILNPDAIGELSSSMPINDAELANVIGNKAKKYGPILLTTIRNFMDQNSITKHPNGTFFIKGVPVNGPQNPPDTSTNKSNSKDTTDFSNYKYTGPPNQSSHYFKDQKRKQTDNQQESSAKKPKQSGNLNPPPIHHSLSSATSASASAQKGGIVALMPTKKKLPTQNNNFPNKNTNGNNQDQFNFDTYRLRQ